jgi:predicted phage gp36 major capsid-like protein
MEDRFKFKSTLIGGYDKTDVLKKFKELNEEYQSMLEEQKRKYEEMIERLDKKYQNIIHVKMNSYLKNKDNKNMQKKGFKK